MFFLIYRFIEYRVIVKIHMKNSFNPDKDALDSLRQFKTIDHLIGAKFGSSWENISLFVVVLVDGVKDEGQGERGIAGAEGFDSFFKEYPGVIVRDEVLREAERTGGRGLEGTYVELGKFGLNKIAARWPARAVAQFYL